MDYHYDPIAERAAAWETMQANVKRRENEARERPFRFEDLNGKPEPARWGPVYPKTASANVEKWRCVSAARELTSEEARAYGQAVHAWINSLNAPKKTAGTLPTTSNCASGQAGEFSAAKHRASIRAKFAADATRDRLAWATGKAIKAAYAQAMAEKRARLAIADMREAA